MQHVLFVYPAVNSSNAWTRSSTSFVSSTPLLAHQRCLINTSKVIFLIRKWHPPALEDLVVFTPLPSACLCLPSSEPHCWSFHQNQRVMETNVLFCLLPPRVPSFSPHFQLLKKGATGKGNLTLTFSGKQISGNPKGPG